MAICLQVAMNMIILLHTIAPRRKIINLLPDLLKIKCGHCIKWISLTLGVPGCLKQLLLRPDLLRVEQITASPTTHLVCSPAPIARLLVMNLYGSRSISRILTSL